MATNRFTWQSAFWLFFILFALGYLIPGAIKLYNRKDHETIVQYCEYKLREEKRAEFETFVVMLDSINQDGKDIEIENHLKDHFLHYIAPDTLTQRQYKNREKEIEKFLFERDVRVLKIENQPRRVRFLFDVYNEYDRLVWLVYFPKANAQTETPAEWKENFDKKTEILRWAKVLNERWAVEAEPKTKQENH